MNTTTVFDSGVKIFRPFLNHNKKNLVFLAKKVFGTYVKDPSNYNKKFLRSNVRKLLPILSNCLFQICSFGWGIIIIVFIRLINANSFYNIQPCW